MEFVAKISIDAPVEDVWELVSSPDRWWLDSNPDHEDIEVIGDERELKVGSVVRIQERIAGVSGEAVGEIKAVEPGQRVIWFAPSARYHLWIFEIEVEEGVEWLLEPSKEGSELSARVWAKFPSTVKGYLAKWIFEHVLNGPARDYEHAMTELRYLKCEIEG